MIHMYITPNFCFNKLKINKLNKGFNNYDYLCVKYIVYFILLRIIEELVVSKF